MALQHLRSSTASKRPLPAGMSDGQLAINTNTASPGLFFKDSAGALIKVGPVHVGTTAPNASPASGGQTGNTVGEQWLDTTGGTYVLKIWDGSAWRSEAGEFVNVTGDTMTGNLVMDNANIVFEGATTDDFETTLTVADPTADRTITLPDQSGSVLVSGNASIVNADVNTSAAIAGTKISPDFGAQNVTTTGTSTAASFIPTSSTVPTNGVYLPAANSVALSTNGTGRLFVDADGKVGIATQFPAAALDLTALSASARAIDIRGRLADNVADVRFLSNDQSTQYGTISSRGNGDFRWFLSSATGSAQVWTNSSERLRITSAGLVGIGTSTPGSLLHLASATGSATPTPTELRIATTTNAGDWSTTNPWGRISYYSADASGGGPKIQAAIDAISSGAAGTSASFDFKLASNLDATLNSVMRINYLGQVGIGTTSPQSKLDVNGDGGTALPTIFSGTAGLVSRTAGTGNFCGFSIIAGTASTSSLNFGDADDEDRGAIQYLHNDDAFRFITAANERARIDSSGRLLVGTSSSAGAGERVQIAGSDYATSAVNVTRTINNTLGPAINLTKTRSAAYGTFGIVSSGDTIGNIFFRADDGTDYDTIAASIVAQVDGTPGTDDMPGRLVFSTTADGASSPTERMRITSDGSIGFSGAPQNTGIGGSETLSIVGGTSSRIYSAVTNATSHIFANTTTGTIISFRSGTTTVGSISVTASATAYNTSSDYRLKENVTPVTDGITRLQQLKPSRFNFIADPNTVVDGFLAHEVQTIVPEAITGEKDAVDDEGNPVYQGIDQSKLVPLLTAALQEAIGEIESLKARVAALESA